MSRLNQFLATASGLLFAVTGQAQAPLPGFPTGTVVSGGPTISAPAPATLTPPSLPVLNTTPVPGQPAFTTGPVPAQALMSGPVTSSQLMVPPSTTGLVPGAVPGTWVQSPIAQVGPDCCGPVGAHGPIGDEAYIRTGVNIPFGKGLLADTMNAGWMTTVGSRSLFFNQSGTAAWIIDPHVSATYNNAGPSRLGFLRREDGGRGNGLVDIVTVRNVFRWSAGLGFGRDWYENAPGFIGGQWNAFYSYGLDAGGRWGTGHVDYQPIGDASGYLRSHDVFGQTYIGANATFNIPMGAYTFFAGGRAEIGYTFSDMSPTGGSFWEVNLLMMAGFRF